MTEDVYQMQLISLEAGKAQNLPNTNLAARELPSIQADVISGSFDGRYRAYQMWCERIGVTFASIEEWERINHQVAEELFAFSPNRNRPGKARSASRKSEHLESGF